MAKLPESILDKLRCLSCNEYLSKPPIRILTNGYGVCGRCKVMAVHLRCELYEILAEEFAFPCLYKFNGCPDLVPWGKDAEHELKCYYKPGCCYSCYRRAEYSHEDYDLKPHPVNDELLIRLKCENCFDYLSSAPVFSTKTGNLCHHCGPMITNKQPNKPLELILQHHIISCSHTKNGCTKRMIFGPYLAKHEFECPFNEINIATGKSTEKLNKILPQTDEYNEREVEVESDDTSSSNDEIKVENENRIENTNENLNGDLNENKN